MLEAYGDIWDNIDAYDAVVITTNGFVKNNGEAVMGRGIALAAKERFPQLPFKLGQRILQHGNLSYAFSINSKYGNTVTDIIDPTGKLTGKYLYCLPVKPVIGPNGEPGWKARADINLIVASIEGMKRTIDYWQSRVFSGIGYLSFEFGNQPKILMPRPGCGNGGLKWENVKPIIEPLLDDRFTVMEKL